MKLGGDRDVRLQRLDAVVDAVANTLSVRQRRGATLLASVGIGALGTTDEPDDTLPLPDTERVRACMRLITRALLIWLVFISALVLIGWVR